MVILEYIDLEGNQQWMEASTIELIGDWFHLYSSSNGVTPYAYINAKVVRNIAINNREANA